MQLNCVNCGASFDPAKVSRKMRFAECTYCGTLHNIAELTAKKSGREYVPPPVFLPKGMSASESDEGIELEFNHINEAATGLAVVGLIFLAGMVITSVLVWGKGTGPSHSLATWHLIARVMWVLAGLPVLVCGYLVFAGLINRQRVLVARDYVRASAGPLPVRRARITRFDSIRGVTARTPKRAKKNAYFAGYDVDIEVDEKQRITILSGFADPEVADVLRHYIMQAVGLEQRATPERKVSTRVLFAQPPANPPAEPPSLPQTVAAPPRLPPRAPAKLELSCRSCGAPIPKERIRKELLAADCTQCGVIQDVRPFLRHGVPRPRRNPGFIPPWYADVGPGHVAAWFRRPFKELSTWVAFLTAMALMTLLGLLLCVFYSWAWTTLLMFPVVFGGSGAWAFLPLLRGRHIAATPKGVVVASLPFASARRQDYPTSAIAQIVSLTTGRGFTLMLITTSNERVPLLDGLTDWAHALYLEQRLESVLGIEDVAVAHARRPSA